MSSPRKSSTKRRSAPRTCSRTLPGPQCSDIALRAIPSYASPFGRWTSWWNSDSSTTRAFFPCAMIAMAFPPPTGPRTKRPRRRENPSSSGRWRRPGFLDFGYPWQEAGTLGCCHTGYRVGDWHPSTDANCDHSSSICTRGKSIQRNRACLPAGCRGFVIIRISENVRSGCGACLASFGSVPRETVLYNSAYFPEQIRHAVGIVFTISLLGLAMELLQPLVGRTTGSEQIHDGFGGLLVSVGDAKALAHPLARLFSEDALVRRLGGSTPEAVRSANSHAGKVAWAGSRIRTEGRRSLDLLARPEP